MREQQKRQRKLNLDFVDGKIGGAVDEENGRRRKGGGNGGVEEENERAMTTGFRPGTYVRVVLEEVPISCNTVAASTASTATNPLHHTPLPPFLLLTGALRVC